MRTKQKERQVNTRRKERATEREKVKEQTLKTGKKDTRPQLLNRSALFLIRFSRRVSHLINMILIKGRMVQQILSGTSITAQSRLKHEDTRVNKMRGNININRSPSPLSAARRPADSSEWASYLTKNKPENNLSFNGDVKRSTRMIKTN